MAQVVRKELTHAAYRRCGRSRVDKVDGGGFSWLLLVKLLLEVIEEMFTVAFPLCIMTSMTLESFQLKTLIKS